MILTPWSQPLSYQPCCGPKDPLCEALTLLLCAHDSEPASQLSPGIPEPWEDGRKWYLCSSTLLCTHVYVNCMYFMCNLLFLLQQLLPLDCPSNNSCKMRPFKCSHSRQWATHSSWALGETFSLCFLMSSSALAEVALQTSSEHGSLSHPRETLAFLLGSSLMRSECCNLRAHSEVAIT